MFALFAIACGSARSTPPKTDASSCMAGNEACPCYENKTCNQGLTYLSNVSSTPAVISADIRWVPYDAFGISPGGAGGPATAVIGASDPSYNEYYPYPAIYAWAQDPSANNLTPAWSGLR